MRDGRPIVAPIIKATFDVSLRGEVTLGAKQAPVELKGKLHGEPVKSSPRLEPETAFIKVATDCVLLGHAVSVRPTTQMDVGVRIGSVGEAARVTGNRWWVEGAVGLTMSSPEPFQLMPLVYERAFGGWDQRLRRKTITDSSNGIRSGSVLSESVAYRSPALRPPNIEDPSQMLTSPNGRATPVGFGFLGLEWQPQTSSPVRTMRRGRRPARHSCRRISIAVFQRGEPRTGGARLSARGWTRGAGVRRHARGHVGVSVAWHRGAHGHSSGALAWRRAAADQPRHRHRECGRAAVDVDLARLHIASSGPHNVSAIRIATTTAVRPALLETASPAAASHT